ncbi:orotidine-5'-phosphate decarboxylase [Candidatus Amarobacter glycogenicus]|uniref:orotidine-5'-phosphate decarboxylase n=1 Tax=Candidatus Amarobacter glycogenicus TaxID=3140699 RepID=UPI0031CCA4E1
MATDFFSKLTAAARKNNSLLCVGLDPTPEAVPAAFRQAANPILAWNRVIIEATADLVCAFKPNIAFYEALDDGLATLKATLRLIPPDTPVILDAKRGDIGSTAAAYARVIFDQLGVDAVTLSPYLGADSSMSRGIPSTRRQTWAAVTKRVERSALDLPRLGQQPRPVVWRAGARRFRSCAGQRPCSQRSVRPASPASDRGSAAGA